MDWLTFLQKEVEKAPQTVENFGKTEKLITTLPAEEKLNLETYIWWGAYFHLERGFIEGLKQAGFNDDAIIKEFKKRFQNSGLSQKEYYLEREKILTILLRDRDLHLRPEVLENYLLLLSAYSQHIEDLERLIK